MRRGAATIAAVVKDGQVSGNPNLGQKWEINLNNTEKNILLILDFYIFFQK